MAIFLSTTLCALCIKSRLKARLDFSTFFQGAFRRVVYH